jgi:hypothetical protein
MLVETLLEEAITFHLQSLLFLKDLKLWYHFVGGILEGIGLLSYAENKNRRNNNLGLNNACLVLCFPFFFFAYISDGGELSFIVSDRAL